jgi:hypothetical protein
MKALLLILAAGFGIQANAEFLGFDVLQPIVRCHMDSDIEEVGMSVVLSEGGLAALSEVEVKLFSFGKLVQTEKYYVHNVPNMTAQVNPPMIYEGQDGQGNTIFFTHNSFVTADDSMQVHGAIRITYGGDAVRSNNLICEPVFHIM